MTVHTANPMLTVAIVYQELQDVLDDAAHKLPPDAIKVTYDTVHAVRDDLVRALAVTYRIEDALRALDYVQQMRNSSAPASGEGKR